MRIVTDEEITDDLARSRDLTSPSAPARVRKGQVKELEAAGERVREPIIVSGVPRAGCTGHFAADVGKLFNESQLLPSPSCETGVDNGRRWRCHGRTRRATMSMIR